jgi:uncharacterized protein YxjI
MDVSIQEKSFSFGVQYSIECATASMTADKKILSLMANIELHSPTGGLLATITGDSFLKTSYNFSLANGRNYHYRCEKMWKGVFVCEGIDESIHLYTHKGLRYSFFQNDNQIAALTKEHFAIGNGNMFHLHMNADADLVLLTCMVLALNTDYGDDHNSNTFTYDFGNMGPQDKAFDDSWQPNDTAKA